MQRLVMPAGVAPSRDSDVSCLSFVVVVIVVAAETATYDCFSSSYLSMSGIKGCEVAGGGSGVGVLLLWLWLSLLAGLLVSGQVLKNKKYNRTETALRG